MPYYHVWFATRSRKWLLQGEIVESVKALFAEIAAEKHIRLRECEAIVDHVHLLLECSDRLALGKAMNALKGISSRRLSTAFPELKFDAETEHIWQKGYGWKVTPHEEVSIVRRYIRTQWERLETFDRPNRLKE